jgi:predicted Zn-dependent protease
MRVAVGVASLLLVAGCNAPPAPRPAPPRPTPGGVIYLVPLGAVPREYLDELVGHHTLKHELIVEPMPAVALEESVVDRSRNQVVAEELIASMERAVPEANRAGPNVLIGITPYDMHIRQVPEWQFAFAYRQGRSAIVAMARMDPLNLGETPDDGTRLRARLRKMVSKQIGLVYLGLPPHTDRRSVLFSPILGIKRRCSRRR